VALVAVLAVSWTQALADAEPDVPQPGSPCAANLADAMTWPSDVKAPLVCAGQPSQWQPVDTPYPVSDRWVSYGPPMKLHGEGLRNSVIESGEWTATPLTPDGRCRADQLAVIPGAGTGAPQTTEGQPGQQLSLPVLPLLFSIEMSGDCLWQKVEPGRT
jgi:hypothetical protein